VAIKIECINLIIPIANINNSKYPGGIEAYEYYKKAAALGHREA